MVMRLVGYMVSRRAAAQHNLMQAKPMAERGLGHMASPAPAA